MILYGTLSAVLGSVLESYSVPQSNSSLGVIRFQKCIIQINILMELNGKCWHTVFNWCLWQSSTLKFYNYISICKTFGGIWVQIFGKTREELRNMLEKYINLCTYNKYRHLLLYFSLNHGVGWIVIAVYWLTTV